MRGFGEPERSPTLREVAERWQASRKDVRDSTRIQHRTALRRVLPLLGWRALDTITADHVQEMVDALNAGGVGPRPWPQRGQSEPGGGLGSWRAFPQADVAGLHVVSPEPKDPVRLDADY